MAGEWKAIALGTTHMFAVKTDGTLWGWGQDIGGQLGNGSGTAQVNSPSMIDAATTWRTVAANAFSSFAARTDGTLWAAGGNSGTLGNGNRTSRVTLGQVLGSTAWLDLAVLQDSDHVVWMAADSTAWACGREASGQMAFAGRNNLIPDLVLPGLSPVQSISFSAPVTVPVGNTITLAATTGSGLPARYLVTGPATVQGDQLRIDGAGLVSVTAYQPGDNFWQSSDMVQRFLNATGPTVTTLAATNIGPTTATIRASINPNGSATTALFQRGTSASYGTNVAINLSPNNGTLPQTVTLALTGLAPGATYHYRATATNGLGTTDGVDLTFTTISNDTKLSALTTTADAFTPPFSGGTAAYSATVPNATASVTVTPTATNAGATLQVRVSGGTFTPLASAATSAPLSVAIGANSIEIVVTAQDGVTQKTYSIAVKRLSKYEELALASGLTGPGSGPLEDFDGDGIGNLLELGFGTGAGNPSEGAAELAIPGGALARNGQPIVIPNPTPGGTAYAGVFIRRKDAASRGLTYTAFFSAELDDWQPGTGAIVVLAEDANFEAVSIPFPADLGPWHPTFFRVEVSIAP